MPRHFRHYKNGKLYELLHIDRIDLSVGQLEVRGKLRELSYEEPTSEGGFWSRLFG